MIKNDMNKIDQTPKAKKFWDLIPSNAKIKILNNVFCMNCISTVGTVSIAVTSMKVEKGNLIISGNCTKCGK